MSKDIINDGNCYFKNQEGEINQKCVYCGGLIISKKEVKKKKK